MWFLWWGDYGSRKLVEFHHYHVAFVVSPSLPFVLGASLLYHLNKFPNELKNTTKKLKFSFYVINCIASVSNEAKLNMFVAESRILLYKAKFELKVLNFSMGKNIKYSNIYIGNIVLVDDDNLKRIK